ncbi:hypothetical protein F183_A55110 (plasmid) [Bryobacterales bacterium F-183]|nr:hypothetical protein F183_A55110 [Bryobacterales bacterium F-183]
MHKLSLVLLVLAATAILFLYGPLAANHPFYYDEADYMWAGKQGVVANSIDRNGIPFTEFVRKGLELSRAGSGQRQSFSQYIRGTGDIGMYRHYHGPVYAYWLAILHNLGVEQEQLFRGSGLILHLLTAALMYFAMLRLFPDMPLIGPLVATLLFLAHRTALTAATIVTQHVIFTLLTVAILAAFSQYFRSLAPRWAYFGMALTGVALATVETAVVLGGAFGLAWLIDWRRQFAQFISWGQRAAFLGRCLLSVVVGIFVVWPVGILQLNILKGYLTLVYIAVYRKTFSPIGPLELLSMKFMVAPFELGLLLVGTLLAFYLLRKQAAALPWLTFTGLFFLVLLKVTAPYTYYYAPLTTSMCVLTGLAAAEIWWQQKLYARVLVCVAVAVSVIGGTVQSTRDLAIHTNAHPPHFAVLDFVRSHPLGGQTLYLPYQFVPTLHYYLPDLKVAGYDMDWDLKRLTSEVTAPGAYERVLCEDKICAALADSLPDRVTDRQFLHPLGVNGGIFYSVRILPASGEQPK